MRAAFVVSKQPYGEIEDGETRITRLLVEAAAECCETVVVALAEGRAREAPVEVVAVPKRPARLAALAPRAALRRRSLIHLRFSPDELARALEGVAADVFVARRAYMAEAAIAAGRVPPGSRLLVLVDVLESTVLRRRRSPLRPLLALEARRTRRDELRCLRAASEVAYFSDSERTELGQAAPAGPRLDLVLPPAAEPAPLSEPVAFFLGDRRWPPNAEALAALLALWPRIAAAAPGARLLLAGHPGPGERDQGPAGVERLGFVPDLDAALRSAAVLLAPVPIGGGVRVKVLDAARHGIPVVGSPEAIGSVAGYLPVAASAGEDEFVERAATLLADRAAGRREGEALYAANRELAGEGFVERQVEALLTAA